MTSQLIETDDRLAAVISHYYCVQLPQNALPVQQQLLPNYEMAAVFNFGPAIPVSTGDSQELIQRTAVLGPLEKILHYELPPGADVIVVNFTLNGFYRLMGKSMHQRQVQKGDYPGALFNQAAFGDLWPELSSMTTLPERLEAISTYAVAHLSPTDEMTRSLMDSIPYFGQMSVDPIKALADTHKVSTRSIQTRFQTHLGYSAKELTRFLRFKKVLQLLIQPTSDTIDWLALVQEFGYHDHSHLIKDFRYFVGLTPRQFVRQIAQGNVCLGKSGKFY